MTRKPQQIKQLQAESRHLVVRQINSDTFVVESATVPVYQHVVRVRFGQRKVYTRCTCKWAMHGGTACSHVMATLEYLAARKGRTLSFWHNQADAKRQKQRVFELQGGVWITSRAD